MALAILNMFDDGVIHLIDRNDIDRTRNAMTLTMEFHQFFGWFEGYFEPQGNQAHTSRIDSVERILHVLQSCLSRIVLFS